jgi:hypothetical protein
MMTVFAALNIGRPSITVLYNTAATTESDVLVAGVARTGMSTFECVDVEQAASANASIAVLDFTRCLTKCA